MEENKVARKMARQDSVPNYLTVWICCYCDTQIRGDQPKRCERCGKEDGYEEID